MQTTDKRIVSAKKEQGTIGTSKRNGPMDCLARKISYLQVSENSKTIDVYKFLKKYVELQSSKLSNTFCTRQASCKYTD